MLIFDSEVQSTNPVQLKLEDVDIVDALDFFALEAGVFWEQLDRRTIRILADNQTKRRDYSPTLVKTIYFEGITTPPQMVEITTILRALLNMRYVAALPGANGIAVMDTPSQVALAEKIISDLRKAKPVETGTGGALTLDAGNEIGGVLRTRAVRKLALSESPLKIKGTGRLSVDINESAHDAFERVAVMAGLHVNFDERFVNGPAQHFSVNDVSIVDALDFLSLQTRNFWKVMDATTILIAPDNQSARRDLEPRTQKVIRLTHTKTETAAREISTALLAEYPAGRGER